MKKENKLTKISNFIKENLLKYLGENEFKVVTRRYPTVWRISLFDASNSPHQYYSIENNYEKIENDFYFDLIKYLKELGIDRFYIDQANISIPYLDLIGYERDDPFNDGGYRTTAFSTLEFESLKYDRENNTFYGITKINYLSSNWKKVWASHRERFWVSKAYLGHDLGIFDDDTPIIGLCKGNSFEETNNILKDYGKKIKEKQYLLYNMK